ncbi:hypothetical protein L9F63_023241, partial [Diploptera punctata]
NYRRGPSQGCIICSGRYRPRAERFHQHQRQRQSSKQVTVNLVQGGLKGKKVTTKAGIPYYSFQGIPYAKPPIGSLRFKPPEPPEPWNGVRDALTEGSVAAQVDRFLRKGFIGSEDCLFLNVYTTKLPNAADDKLKPVMVWVHGGGYFMGSGNTDMYGPDYLMAGDVVLVTLNYRLGPLGFISTGDSEIPGNNGLKDQIMALRWVQLNIAHFGGDSGNVTIFGESAGGASVHLLMLSPMSKGLFHRVIAQSGVAICSWTYSDPAIARKKAFKLGETLGCKTNSSKELVKFLLNVPIKDLLEGVDQTLGEEGKHPLPLYFAPTKEEEKENEERFLADSPMNIIKEDKFHQLPLIMGYTSEEGIIILRDAIEYPEWYESLNDKFHILISRLMDIEDEAKAVEIANKIKNFYFGDKRISKETYKEYAGFFSDFWFLSQIYKVAEKQIVNSKVPIYMYRFAHDGILAFTRAIMQQKCLPGASHGDDLGYLFHMAHHEKLNLDSEHESMKVMNKTIKMWTNFAKTGNPTPENDPDLGITWNPISKTDFSYLNIDTDLTVQNNVNKESLAFWEDIFATFIGFGTLNITCELFIKINMAATPSCYYSNMVETVTVKVEQGFLRGRIEKSVFGREFYSFKGIPYAKPPLGYLRFK